MPDAPAVSPTSSWLAPHLAADERALWTLAPGSMPWPRVLISAALAVWVGYWASYGGSWWRELPIWPETHFSPIVGGAIAVAGFALDAGDRIVAARFTGWAVTQRRVVRVRTLGGGQATAWPREHTRIVEREKDKRRIPTRARVRIDAPAGTPQRSEDSVERTRIPTRARVRIEVRRPDGRREARFRITGAYEPEALAAALSAPAAAPAA